MPLGIIPSNIQTAVYNDLNKPTLKVADIQSDDDIFAALMSHKYTQPSTMTNETDNKLEKALDLYEQVYDQEASQDFIDEWNKLSDYSQEQTIKEYDDTVSNKKAQFETADEDSASAFENNLPQADSFEDGEPEKLTATPQNAQERRKKINNRYWLSVVIMLSPTLILKLLLWMT